MTSSTTNLEENPRFELINEDEMDSSILSPAQEASKWKEDGNEHFKHGQYLDALSSYGKALDICPKTDDLAYSRAVYLSNRAACYVHLARYEDAIVDCDQAIELAPKYVKPYLRRSQAYEKMEKLDEALQDMKHILEIDSTVRPAIESHARLSTIIDARNEKMKAEMMGKLKGLGNTILGKFGMSTDNFQMVQDPETGGYSVNYKPPSGSQQ